MKASIGRTVHYVLDRGPNTGDHRPAVIVRVWTDTLVNLQVITDDENDKLNPVEWRTSVSLDDSAKNATWHWPERDEA